MRGHKNIPSANPLFSGIIMAHPILHFSKIRVKTDKPTVQFIIIIIIKNLTISY